MSMHPMVSVHSYVLRGFDGGLFPFLRHRYRRGKTISYFPLPFHDGWSLRHRERERSAVDTRALLVVKENTHTFPLLWRGRVEEEDLAIFWRGEGREKESSSICIYLQWWRLIWQHHHQQTATHFISNPLSHPPFLSQIKRIRTATLTSEIEYPIPLAMITAHGDIMTWKKRERERKGAEKWGNEWRWRWWVWEKEREKRRKHFCGPPSFLLSSSSSLMATLPFDVLSLLLILYDRLAMEDSRTNSIRTSEHTTQLLRTAA